MVRKVRIKKKFLAKRFCSVWEEKQNYPYLAYLSYMRSFYPYWIRTDFICTALDPYRHPAREMLPGGGKRYFLSRSVGGVKAPVFWVGSGLNCY